MNHGGTKPKTKGFIHNTVRTYYTIVANVSPKLIFKKLWLTDPILQRIFIIFVTEIKYVFKNTWEKQEMDTSERSWSTLQQIPCEYVGFFNLILLYLSTIFILAPSYY